MIKNKEYLEEFEKQLAAKEKVDFFKNLEIYEALWHEAETLGIFPLKDPYDGVEDDIRLAKILSRLPQRDVDTNTDENN
jgi:hypothetical protein